MTALAVFALLAAQSTQALPPQPIIDMHLHAYKMSEFGPEPPKLCMEPQTATMEGIDPREPFDFSKLIGNCAKPFRTPADDASLISETVEVLQRRNFIAVTSGAIET